MGDFPLGVDPLPIGGNVLVKLTGNATMSAGGIHIPETVVNKPVQGTVEAVSQGYVKEGMWVNHEVHIGDVVIFNWKTGFDLVLDDGSKPIYYRIVHEKDIVAILKGVNYGEDV
jgi:co-chaperonin GroES (HSP10)